MKREEFLNTLFENIPDYTKEEQEELSTTNGSIHFEEIDAKDIQLKTSNANIKVAFEEM